MVKIIGKGALKVYSQEIVLTSAIRVQDLPVRLKLPIELAEITIMVRNHQKLDDDEFIYVDDEIYLFMAVMGG